VTHCIKCHRPLRLASPDGYGPVCRKAVRPVPAYERDLFPYDLDRAFSAASSGVQVHIDAMAAEAYIAVRDGFRAARERLLGWEVRG
jgi:hypothetical protein